ncbi:MAG: hypothetical protein KBT63_06250 [Porticoccaceae bacterium]|nr:hypothetical protein [Porticoccaceae bacterium]
MRINLAIFLLLFASNAALAESWGPDAIKFNLEDSSKIQTMLWVSGYSYSSTAIYRRLGCLKKDQNIGSKYLVEKLNSKYSGIKITSEEASKTLDLEISNGYPCGPPYNKKMFPAPKDARQI